jgi:hypothetical protein
MYLATGSQNGFGSASIEIPEGDEGTAQTIALIRQLVYQGVRDASVNRTAVGIVQTVPAHRPDLEARAIYDWVRANIRFTPDISSAETLRTAAEILRVRAGDCDCSNGILLPTLFSSVGLDSRLVTVAADDSRPDIFSHIYPEVMVNGQWTPADAAAEHASWGKEPGHVYRKRVWDLETDSYQDLKGVSFLGQDDGFDWGALAQTIAVGTTGVAQIVRAASVPTLPVGSYGLQPVASATATVSSSGGLFVGVGLLALIGLLVMH